MIDDRAFEGSNITSVTIPESITSISGGAFRLFRNMKSITIPDGITIIGEGAFYGCSNLTSVTIPDSVTRIDRWAFEGCGKLERIVFERDTPSTSADYDYTCSRGIFSRVAETAKIFINPAANGSLGFGADGLLGTIHDRLPVEFLPKEIEISTVSTGAAPFSFTFETEPDTAYRIDSTSDLSPEGEWTKIGSIPGSGEPVEFSDKRKALFPMQFYRVVMFE